jgi:hypothetical protein
MAEKNPETLPQSKQTVKDDEIITERKFGRRSFMTAVGALVVGGAAALAMGERMEAGSAALQQRSDPDQKKTTTKKASTKAKPKASTKKTTKKTTRSDPDQKKGG